LRSLKVCKFLQLKAWALYATKGVFHGSFLFFPVSILGTRRHNVKPPRRRPAEQPFSLQFFGRLSRIMLRPPA
jgi:hypothetical protein